MMRLKSFRIRDSSGIDFVEVDDLSDIVVIAGPNGVGKTRILAALGGHFRNPKLNPNVSVVVEATNDLERTDWGKSSLDTSVAGDPELLRARLRRNQRRSRYSSTVLNFESDRSITKIEPFAFTWDWADPMDEEIGWDTGLGMLRDRFNDVQHSLFKIVEGQKRKIAEEAIKLKEDGANSMSLDFSDLLTPYRDAFYQLLGPKKLQKVDPKTQQITYELGGEERNLTTLSSGEREVVNIIFDFLLRQPSDCIVFFDEPELHLHPELSYRLLQTLSAVGKNNQFVFCTHSPEIITASIENTVIFVTPRNGLQSNQAMIVSRDDETHHALNLLGQSVGVISLGRKLLLIEGNESSLDKQTYGAILKNEYPEIVLVPVGGKSAISAFDEIYDSVLNRTIWGVEFFMLCDRDAQHAIGPRAVASRLSDRFFVLPRYHLENYFLDAEVLIRVFASMEADESSWLRNADAIEEVLKDLASQSVPYAVALTVSAAVRERVGNVDAMPRSIGTTLDSLLEAFSTKIDSEAERVADGLDKTVIEELANAEFERLHSLLEGGSGTWRQDIPGRIILRRFAAKANLPVGRLKTMYLRHAPDAEIDPFEDIRAIFASFRGASLQPSTTSASTPVTILSA